MDLHQILDLACPSCGAEAVEETRAARAHSNGTRIETRVFGCGCKLVYSPNFRSVAVARHCPHEKDYRERNVARTAALEAMYACLDGLDVDDEWRKEISLWWPRRGRKYEVEG